jgi:TolB protein
MMVHQARLISCLAASLVVTIGPAAGERRGDVDRTAPQYAIAFASFAPLNSDIFIAAGDGSNAKPLMPNAALDYNASFSSDGSWIVFTSERNGSADIYRVHPDGSGLKRLTDDPAFDDQGALSPDGKSLAFVSTRSGQAEIWILDLASGALRNLTRDPAGDFRPAWSPDGQWIAFSSDRDSRKPRFGFTVLQSTEIYLIHPDGTGLRRITHGDAFAGSPAWSADGKRLVFYEAAIAEVDSIRSPLRKRGTTQIVQLDLATNEYRRLTTGNGEKWSPHWVAGDRLAYGSGGPDGGVEFVSGKGGARGEIRSPSWSPDGRQMVFHRDVGGEWPPLREWASRDPLFRLVRTGVFPSYSPTGDRLAVNDAKAGILHNSIVLMAADGSHRAMATTKSTPSGPTGPTSSA